MVLKIRIDKFEEYPLSSSSSGDSDSEIEALAQRASSALSQSSTRAQSGVERPNSEMACRMSPEEDVYDVLQSCAKMIGATRLRGIIQKLIPSDRVNHETLSTFKEKIREETYKEARKQDFLRYINSKIEVPRSFGAPNRLAFNAVVDKQRQYLESYESDWRNAIPEGRTEAAQVDEAPKNLDKKLNRQMSLTVNLEELEAPGKGLDTALAAKFFNLKKEFVEKTPEGSWRAR